jgi:hypothetical protein
MTRQDLQRLASKEIKKTEPLQRLTGRDTYVVISVFKDTSFLTEQARDQDKKAK